MTRSRSSSARRRPSKLAKGGNYSALIRALRIHTRLASQRSATTRSLADELEVSPRTILRDIELLEDSFGAKVRREPGTQTYYYEGDCEHLPLLHLEPIEALALVLAGETFAAWHGALLGNALRSALGKIAEVMGDTVEFPAEAWRPHIIPATTAGEGQRERQHFPIAANAIRRRRILSVVYRKPSLPLDAPPPEPRPIHPLRLAWLDGRWAIIAYDPIAAELKAFLLTRVVELIDTGKTYTPPECADVDRFLKGSMGRHTGEAEIEVRIAFDAPLVGYLVETPWHASQKLTPLPDGSAEATFLLNNLIDIRRRVLACGGRARVLAPPELRRAVAHDAAALFAGHDEENGQQADAIQSIA